MISVHDGQMEMNEDEIMGYSDVTIGFEGTWLYCDYFIWCVICTVVVLTCFVVCGCVYVWVL